MNRPSSGILLTIAGLAAVVLVCGCRAATRYAADQRPAAAETAVLEPGSPDAALLGGRAGFDELLVFAREASAGGGMEPAAAAGLLVQDVSGAATVQPETTAVAGRISAGAAVVSVTQRFRNPSRRPASADYVLPLPAGAAVTDFVMTVGERRIRAVIREREKAERIYREARRRGYLVSLVAARSDRFALRLGNLAPGAAVDARTSWFCPLGCRDGWYELRLPPLASADREGPAGGFSLQLSLDAGMPVESVETPGQAATIERPTPATAEVRLSAPRAPDAEFVLRYRLPDAAARAGVLVHAGGEDRRTFALTLQPPRTAREHPRDATFLADGPDGFAAGREAVTGCLQELRAGDRFRLAGLPGWEDLRPADADALSRAQADLAGSAPVRKQETAELLKSVLQEQAEAGRTRRVVLLTDGCSSERLLAALRSRPAGTRVFVAAAGTVVDVRGVEQLAAAGGGQAVFVLAGNAAEAGGELARLLDGPVLTDLRVEWGGLAVADLQPGVPGELFPGRPLTIVGRAPAGGRQRIVVTGRSGDREWRQELELDLDEGTASNPAVERLWQLRRLLALEDAELTAPGAEARRRIVEASLESGLASRYTGLMAVDTLAPATGPAEP